MKTDSKAGPAVTDTGGKPMYNVRRVPRWKLDVAGDDE